MRTPLSWSPERRRLDDDRALARWWPAAARRALSGVVVPRHEREPADADVRDGQDGDPETDPKDPRAQSLRPREPRGVLIDEGHGAADDRQGHEPRPHGLA